MSASHQQEICEKKVEMKEEDIELVGLNMII